METGLGRVIPRAQTVICSAEFRHAGTDDSDSSARALVRLGVPTVMVTHGADRCAGGMVTSPVRSNRLRFAPSTRAAPATCSMVLTVIFAARTGRRRHHRADQRRCGSLINCRFLGTRSWLRDLPESRPQSAVVSDEASWSRRGSPNGRMCTRMPMTLVTITSLDPLVLPFQSTIVGTHRPVTAEAVAGRLYRQRAGPRFGQRTVAAGRVNFEYEKQWTTPTGRASPASNTPPSTLSILGQRSRRGGRARRQRRRFVGAGTAAAASPRSSSTPVATPSAWYS